MEQADASPDVARLSDEDETRFSLVFASPGGAVERLGRAYLRARGRESGCLAIVGFEGTAEDVERRRVRTGSLLRAGGGIALGRRPGELWVRSRYTGPYLRDELLDRAILVDTLETAGSWTNGGPRRRPPPRPSWPRAARSPTITPSGATMPAGCARRWERWAWS